jgi:tRNA threonylcarbamoyladenosine biosynthesis protein TsaB
LARILLIESATAVCSVALAECGAIVAMKSSNAGNDHAANLTVFIRDLIEEQGLTFSDLDAIAVSMGPGSYTGLRIGVSVAKGICYAAEKPLIAVSTLEAMVSGYVGKYQESERIDSDDLFCPMIDARRMEVYSAVYNSKGNMIREIQAEIIDDNSFGELLQSNRLHFFGSGAPKTSHFFSDNPKANLITDFEPSASDMMQIARRKFSEGEFENVAYFEPFYLKDFVAAKPRVKGL